MDEHKYHAMIALLPITTNWSKLTLPHLTLVFAGNTFDHGPHEHNELLKTAASLAFDNRPIQLEVISKEVFGDEEKVDVYRLQPTLQLLKMRRRVERWNTSKFPFNPHVTIGPKGSFTGSIPPAIAFDRVFVSWGEQDNTFWMKP